MITQRLVDDATNWHEVYNKPVLVSEYGADTQEGLHIVRRYSKILIYILNDFLFHFL